MPEYRAEQVRAGIAADDLADAESIVAEIVGFARVCPEPEPEPTPSPGADSRQQDRDQQSSAPPRPLAAAASPPLAVRLAVPLPVACADDRAAGLHRAQHRDRVVNTRNPLNALPLGFTHRRRRGAELFLLLLSLAVGIGGYAAVGLGVEGEVPVDILGYGGWLAVLCLGAHLVVRVLAPYADPVHAADRRRAQRTRSGGDLPDRPGQAGRERRRHRPCPATS